MIAVVHWLKRIIIVQKPTLVVEFWVLLSSCWSPLLVDCSCDVIYVAMHVWATTMMWPNAIPCVNEHVDELFFVCNLEKQPVIDLCRSPMSEKAIVSYTECILLATVCHESYCALIGMSHYTGSLWTRHEYELVDDIHMGQECSCHLYETQTKLMLTTKKKNFQGVATFWQDFSNSPFRWSPAMYGAIIF